MNKGRHYSNKIIPLFFSELCGMRGYFLVQQWIYKCDISVTLLGYKGENFQYVMGSQGLVIKIPTIPLNMMPCQWAWVLKLSAIM